MIDGTKYKVIHVGISGGKDSTALFLWCLYESGWPHELFRFTFCDTGNEDALTYAYIDMLRTHAPIEVLRPERDFWELAEKRGRFPSHTRRFCTQHLKIIPAFADILAVQELLDEQSSVASSTPLLLALSGIRKDEGTSENGRGDLEMFTWNEVLGCDKYLPIYEYSLKDVWDIHQKHLSITDVQMLVWDDPNLSTENKQFLTKKMTVPCNPLYYMGARRVGCFPCIYARKAEIRAMAKFRPERIQYIAKQEIRVGKKRISKYSTFFTPKKTPMAHRSLETVNKEGKITMVPTIHDVVAWSKTSWGGKKYEMDFYDNDDEIIHCDARGACE